MTDSSLDPLTIASLFTIVFLTIIIVFEILIHKHIVELKFANRWRLAIYLNLAAITSYEVGVIMHHYPQFFVTIFFLLCPYQIGYCVKFWNSIVS